MNIQSIDNYVVKKSGQWFLVVGRLSLFVVYFWFGILKILDTSPANPLVEQLQRATLPFLSFSQFIILFSLFEMLIGILFLIPKLTRFAAVLFALHMITTFMPLVFLPGVSWSGWFTPTLEGQYIIKNLALIAVVLGLLSRLKPVEQK